MVIALLLSKLHGSSILWCNNLLLHPICNRLISMISNLSPILHTVGGDATNSPWINTIWAVSKVINRTKQMKVAEIVRIKDVTYLGLLMFLGERV